MKNCISVRVAFDVSRQVQYVRALILVLAGLIGASPTPAGAQVSIGPQGVYRIDGGPEPANRNRQVHQIVVTPAAEPDPPLKHALYPRSYELQPGNSVSYWYRAMLDLGRMYALGQFDQFNENMDLWLDGPVSELPLEDVKQFLAAARSDLDEARTASLRAESEWDLGLYDLTGTDTVYFLLPEFQESRSLARLLSLKARVAIAEGNYDEALEWFRANFRLANDVAQPETLINKLIGTAIISITSGDVIDLLAAPDCPNLYWALAAIPQPPIDYRQSYEFEQTMPERYIPWLGAPIDDSRTPEAWRSLFRQTVRDLSDASDDLGVDGDAEDWRIDLFSTALIARNYTSVKRDLIAWGHDADTVEAMPVGQAVALHQQSAYRHLTQHTSKWALLPFAVSQQRDGLELQRLREGGWLTPGWESREVFPIVSVLMPAFAQAREAEARGSVRPIALMVIEALRMHAFGKQRPTAGLA